MSDHPLSILKWLHEAGDDVALAESPINRFEETNLAKEQASSKTDDKKSAIRANIAERAKSVAGRQNAESRATSRMPAATPANDATIAKAKEIASAANDLNALMSAIEAFDGCNLKMGAKNTVFSTGNPKSKIMIVGKSPDNFEDASGIPFDGPSGDLLEKMLGAIGLSSKDIYLTTSTPWATPGSRQPTPAEFAICQPFVTRHIELAQPKIAIAMGDTPSKMLIDAKMHVTRVRGKWEEANFGGYACEVVAMLHPNDLIAQPAQKALAWQDLLSIKAKLATL